jgi:hypothetical protein
MCGRFAITTARFHRIEGPSPHVPGGPPPLQHLPVAEHPGHPRVRRWDPRAGRDALGASHALVEGAQDPLQHLQRPRRDREASVPRPVSVEALPHPGVGFLRMEDRGRPQTAVLPDRRGRRRACLRAGTNGAGQRSASWPAPSWSAGPTGSSPRSTIGWWSFSRRGLRHLAQSANQVRISCAP